MFFSTTVSCPLDLDRFRVRQVAGMFDLPLASQAEITFRVELPQRDEPWQIGLIVGPSGSGKSTIARAAYGEHLYQPGDWPAGPVVDAFAPELSTRDIVAAFTAVGFSSPPAWLRPYVVLSQGERFRCDLARALLAGGPLSPLPPTQPASIPLVVFDEYTSVVDRTVAQIGSAAVAKAIRQAATPRRFIAVTCHDDVAPWLQPDWLLDMATGQLTRRRLRRPRLSLAVVRCRRAAWSLFAPHHYLSSQLNPAARCYLGLLGDRPVAFAALLSHPARRGAWRVSRAVVLPDVQGIGIGGRFLAAVAEHHLAQGHRVTITTSHPAMIRHLRGSPRWKVTAVQPGGYARSSFTQKKDIRTTSAGRTVVSAQFAPPR